MPPKSSKAPNPLYVPPGKVKKPRKEIDYLIYKAPELTGSEVADFAETEPSSMMEFKSRYIDYFHNLDLYNSGKYSDFAIECNGRTFKVHKAVVW